ncbi:YheU family protein [Pseudomaricurvus sp. HS19]|uniref:YheU family protein n=1 Tax=Pseudomaricurvus sp. HS19 TaxID=2692626 RepID=UPI0013689BA8|nr:YheU family protein [Pseudomaricurvus sp. HS19]
MEIPWQRLSPEALRGLMEEFITREGTDYGESEVELEEKVLQVERQIRAGEVVIVFDAVLETCSLLTRQAAREFERQMQSAAERGDYDDY